MSAFDNHSKEPTDQEWHPMGSSFTTSGTPSAPAEPRETWSQRMSRRVMQSRDPSDPRVGPVTRPIYLGFANVTTNNAQASSKQSELSKLGTGKAAEASICTS